MQLCLVKFLSYMHLLRIISALDFLTEKEILNSILPQFLCVYPNNLVWGEKNNKEHVRYKSDCKLPTYQAVPTEFPRQEKPVLFCQNSKKKKKKH